MHHWQLYVGTKHRTFFLMTMYIISFILFFPLTILIDNTDDASQMYMSDFSEVMASPPFWLSLTFTTSLVVLPYIGVHTIWFAYLYPQFNQKNDYS